MINPLFNSIRAGGRRMLLASVLGFLIATWTSQAANILWVSDNPEAGDNSFHPPIPAAFDHAFVVMLQNAGHNIARFNPPGSQNTLLSAAQLAAINTNDLIIIGRASGSGAFQAPQGAQWNTNVIKPLICMSPYLVRTNAGAGIPGRMGWFNGDVGPDNTPTVLKALDGADPETDYLFGGVSMVGDTTALKYDEPLDRNSSVMLSPVVLGGKILANATFPRQDNGVVVTATMIAEFPTGTMVRMGLDRLPAYRMFFAGGSRELSGSVTNAGKENLSATGESIFLRAVQLAINNGTSPADPSAPAGISAQPVGVTVVENLPVTFSVSVTGAPPRTVQWQRAASAGAEFFDIPGATTPFQNSTVNLPAVTPADNGAVYRVVVTTSAGQIFSDSALLTVITDVTAPTIVRSVGKWTLTNILVSFSERLTTESANFPFNYSGDNGLTIESATLDATGTNVVLTTSPQVPGTLYTITISDVVDRAAVPNSIAANSPTSFTSWAASRGFLTSEFFLGVAGNAISTLATHPAFPHSPDISSYVNISSNAATSPGRDNYGARLLGWIIPPVDGAYTFYIRGDDGTELRLSPTAEPDARVTIASQTAANQPFTSGASAPQTLVAGQRYFVEALWKEGTGGDYMQFAWQRPDSTNIVSVPTESIETYANPEGVSVGITQHPIGASAIQNRTVTFSVAASIAPVVPAALVSYQWQKGDGAGGFTNAGAPNRSSFTTPLLQFPADDGSQWRAIVAVPGGSATSDVAVVTVTQDLTPPVALSAGSLNGLNIGICFDEILDGAPGLNSANDSFNYTVNGVNPINVTVRPDNKSVILQMDSAVGATFSVEISSVMDRAGNPMAATTLAGTSFGLLSQDIGVPGRPGSSFVCDSTNIEVIGGGADIWNNADTNHWVYRPITGDFDARVQVSALAGLDGTTKAALMMRETTNSNSRVIHLNVNPLTGRNQLEAGQRTTVGGATASWATSAAVIPANVPNSWLRLVRSGTSWSGYFSSNGVDWVLTAQTSQTYPSTVLIGLGVTARNNTLLATGTFSSFTVTQPAADVGILSLAGPAAVSQGSNVTYTLTITNRGPDVATGVMVTNVLPAGLTFVSATATQGTCANASGTVTCNLGTLNANGVASITLVAMATTAGTKNDTAVVTSNAQESNATDNSVTTTTVVVVRPTVVGLSFNAGTGVFSGSFQTTDGVTYEVQYKDRLEDPIWQPVTTIVGDGSSKPFTDSGGAQRFYRIIVP